MPLASAISMRLVVDIGADHAAAIGREQLRGDLAEDAEADHHDGLAERRLGAPHALHGDRAERHGRGGVEASSSGTGRRG